MIAIVRRALKSRPMRKFVRSRLAVAGLAVIMVYVLVGVACFCGLVTRRDADDRIGPNAVLGWFEKDTGEHRRSHCEFYTDRIKAALKREDVPGALRESAMAERRPADVSIDTLKRLVKDSTDKNDAVAAKFDRINAARIRLDKAEKDHAAVPPPDADETGNEPDEPPIMSRADLARVQADAEAGLVQLESVVAKMWPHPEGKAGTTYWLRTCLGIDRQGRSISVRAIYSVRVALQVGLIVGLLAVTIGTFLGAAAAFFGGWVDHAVSWLYSTFSSIPELVLLSLLAYVFLNMGQLPDELIPVYAALALTFWIGPCRVIRGEVLKIKELEYVQAATSIGFGRLYILLKHIIPNTIHLMFINFSLLFIAAIKAEVILTFLGLGVKDGTSWGIMISQSKQEVINGNFWQIGAATVLMFGLVLAFNVVSDALQDAFDPKHVG